MELIYTASKPTKLSHELGKEEWPQCALSNRNLIAFTTTLQLHPAAPRRAEQEVLESLDGSATSSSSSANETTYHVNVCDIDSPWEVHRLMSSPEAVVLLRWDTSATRLLLVTSLGKCQIWEMKDYLVNSWRCIQTSSIDGETVVAATWLNTGVRMDMSGEKKDNASYSEKFNRAKFQPTLSRFGGKAAQGWVALTASGMVCVCMLHEGREEGRIELHSLAPWRTRVTIADLAYSPSGDILAIVSDGNLCSAIQSYKISIKSEEDSEICVTTCKCAASFYARCHTDGALKDSQVAHITHVQYMPTESGDVVVVGAGDNNNSHVELWTLSSQKMPIHRLYTASGSGDATHRVNKWSHKSSVTHGSLPISIAVARFPISYENPDHTQVEMFQYVAIAYKDGSVKLVRRSNFLPMTTTNLDMGVDLSSSGGAVGGKRRRVVPYMVHMQQTFTGCNLVGLDQASCLYVMKAVNTRDPVTQVSPAYLVPMLEYMMLAGFDWWDVVAALKPGMMEVVIQKLNDNFNKQASHFQDQWFTRFMAVKSTLYRSSSSGQQRAADCHCHMMLSCIIVTFKSLLRPKTANLMDMSPSDRLAVVCSKNTETDIDKLILSLNPEKKEFIVDLPTLQALQPLIQWVGDLTIYLLSSLTTFQHYSNFPGSSIVSDSAALTRLREAIVLIRVWSFINPNCLPHFNTTSAKFDCLATLFKLLTRVWITRKNEGSNTDFEDSLLDECCLLPNHVLVPPVSEGLFGDTRYESSVFFQSHPMTYTFGEVPAHAARGTGSSAELPPGQAASRQKTDVIRQVSLGTSPVQPVKQCTRCGCMSLRSGPTAASSALRAWDMRWMRACVCGGHWKLVNVEE